MFRKRLMHPQPPLYWSLAFLNNDGETMSSLDGGVAFSTPLEPREPLPQDVCIYESCDNNL